MTELSGYPFSVFAGGKPKSGCRVAALIRPAFAKAEVSQQWIPDSFGDVSVAERITGMIGEDKVQVTGDFVLLRERLENRTRHQDVSRRTVCFRRPKFTIDKGFPYQNLPAIKIDIAPLKAVDFAGTQAR